MSYRIIKGSATSFALARVEELRVIKDFFFFAKVPIAFCMLIRDTNTISGAIKFTVEIYDKDDNRAGFLSLMVNEELVAITFIHLDYNGNVIETIMLDIADLIFLVDELES